MITKLPTRYQFKSFVTVPSGCMISYGFTVSGKAKLADLVSFDKLTRTFTFNYVKDLNLLERSDAPYTDYTVTILARSGVTK